MHNTPTCSSGVMQVSSESRIADSLRNPGDPIGAQGRAIDEWAQ